MIKKIQKILKKKNRSKIVCLTAYSKNVAEILDKYCDIVLVGDSLGSVLYEMNSTREVNLDMMILHAKSVRRGISKSTFVVDMPYKSFRNKTEAYKNAKKVMKETKCDAIKLEGGTKIFSIVKYLVAKNIPVMGHIGLLPQSQRGKFRYKGRSKIERKNIFKDAISLEKAGAFSIVIECVEKSLAKSISRSVKIPTIGIGASQDCDGQILVTDDLIGLTSNTPRFVKKYLNIRKLFNKTILKYRRDVINRKFPTKKNLY